MPSVDIVIPFHAQYEAVISCLASVQRCTPNQDYRIYLADDASPNPHFIKPLQHRRLIPLRSDTRLGFGGVLWEAFKQGTSPWVVFMHSDVIVPNINWLTNLQRAMYALKEGGVKLIAAQTDDIGTGIQQEQLIRSDPLPDHVIATSALPLICAMVHRDLFTKIGGFIKPYPLAWFEDEELFWRMKHYGYKQAICKDSFVHHAGGLTIREAWRDKPATRKQMEGNETVCLNDIKPFRKESL